MSSDRDDAFYRYHADVAAAQVRLLTVYVFAFWFFVVFWSGLALALTFSPYPWLALVAAGAVWGTSTILRDARSARGDAVWQRDRYEAMARGESVP